MNPSTQEPKSLQCSVCGEWKPTHGTVSGRTFSRFHFAYKTIKGAVVKHNGNVCVNCESQIPGWKPYPHPELEMQLA